MEGGLVERQRIIGPLLGIALLGLAAWSWSVIAVVIGLVVAAVAAAVLLRRPLPNIEPQTSPWRIAGVAVVAVVFGVMLSDLPVWFPGTMLAVAGGIFLGLGVRTIWHPALRSQEPRLE